MTAIREILKVDNHQIHYTLPKNFDYNEVEVIILPKQEDISDNDMELNPLSNHSASTVEEWLGDEEDEIWK